MKLNRSTVVLAVIFGMVAADAFAQLGSIRGKFVDEGGNPVPDIECEIQLSGEGGRRTKTKTNENGELTRGGIRPGVYTITCKKEGFRPTSLQTQVSAFDQSFLGEHVMYELAPGELSEEEHERATELLEQFGEASESGNHEETLQNLFELKEMMPESTEIDFNIASTYEKTGDKTKAIEYYEKAANANPELAYDAWLAVGDLHGKDKEWAEAASAMGKAIEIRDTDAVAVFNYAVYLMNSGDSAGAKAAYEKTIAIDPNRPLAYYQLGLIAVGNAENDAAIQHFEKFLELQPDHPQAPAAQEVIKALKAKSGEPQ